MSKTLRVFISYSHDSTAHSARVLGLAQRLRRDGVDCFIDQFAPFPPEGWIRWMEGQLRESDFVLCVCTPGYRARFEGRHENRDGKGSSWEGQIISQCIYDDKGKNSRFVAVVFDDHDVQELIPPALKPYTHFVLDGEYERLYGLVTGQSAVRALPVGDIRELKVISPGMPDAGVSFGAANLIDHSLREITAGPSDSAAEALYELERSFGYVSDGKLRDAVVHHLVSYIRALDTSRTYPCGERLFRADVVRMLVRLTDGRLGEFLTLGGLQGIDLAMFDFRGADLTGTDFSGSFAVECASRSSRGAAGCNANYATRGPNISGRVDSLRTSVSGGTGSCRHELTRNIGDVAGTGTRLFTPYYAFVFAFGVVDEFRQVVAYHTQRFGRHGYNCGTLAVVGEASRCR